MEKVYGPYTRKDGRKHVIVYNLETQARKTISYPKWLMEQYLGRKLEDWETVDHINRDFTDDRIENFQILERKEHSSLDARRVKRLRLACVWCGNVIMRFASKTRERHKEHVAGPFCSKRCSGQYGSDVQNNRIDKLPPHKKYLSEYFLKSKLP